MPTLSNPTQQPIPGNSAEADPKLRAEIEAVYAAMEQQEQQPAAGYAEVAPETGTQPFLKKLKADAVVDQTEVARAQALPHNRNMHRFIEPKPAVAETEYLLHTGSLLRSYRETAANRPSDITYHTTTPKSGILRGSLKMLTGSDNVRLPRFKLSSRPTHRQLIDRESELGGQLFPKDEETIQRQEHWQFFNLDPYTWFWHKEWIDQTKKAHSNTTRYEIHENGIMKVQDGAPYYFIEGHELQNFMTATRLYYERVSHDIYHRDPATGQPLAVS